MNTYQVKISDFVAEIGEPKEGEFGLISIQDDHWIVKHDNKIVHATIKDLEKSTKTYTIEIDGENHKIQLLDTVDQQIELMGMNAIVAKKLDQLTAPMPGMIIKVLKNVGDEIEDGDAVLIVEAMKMENVLKANGAGVISKILVKQGDKVDKNQVLIKF